MTEQATKTYESVEAYVEELVEVAAQGNAPSARDAARALTSLAVADLTRSEEPRVWRAAQELWEALGGDHGEAHPLFRVDYDYGGGVRETHHVNAPSAWAAVDSAQPNRGGATIRRMSVAQVPSD